MELVGEIAQCSKSVQICTEHQKCITDDVLQLSGLHSHKLTVVNAYYSPCDLLDTIVKTFRAPAEQKVFMSFTAISLSFLKNNNHLLLLYHLVVTFLLCFITFYSLLLPYYLLYLVISSIILKLFILNQPIGIVP
jgi:hypothetical protein